MPERGSREAGEVCTRWVSSPERWDGAKLCSANPGVTGVGGLGRTQDLDVVVLRLTPAPVMLLQPEQMQLSCC